jgi:tetratricopeptide (TPR) repeat protein
MRQTTTWLITLLLFCGLAVLPRPVVAQTTGGLSGEVRDLNGKLFADVTIVFKNRETGVIYTVKTDSKGHYSQLGMHPGVYDVTVKVKDQVVLNTQCGVEPRPDNSFDINFKEIQAGESPEQKALRKKQEEERTKAEGMKASFMAGVQKSDEAQLAANEMAKLPADQRAAAKEKVNSLYEQALADFQRAQQAAAEKDPNLHLIYYKIGYTYDMMGKYAEAAAAYQKATELKPDQAAYYNNLGNVLAKLGKIDQAQAAYEKSASLDPANAASAWTNFGVVLYNANRLADAVEPLKKATTLAPNQPDAWYLLGASLLATMQTKQEGEKLVYIPAPGTAEAYQKYLQLAPNGKFANEAKAALEGLATLGAGVDTKVKVKKGKP